MDAVWELDLFGGQRRNVESADANIQAAIESIRDVQVSLIAEVALNYIQLRGYQQEIVIAQNNLKAQKHTAEITHKRLNVGFASALDVANADSNVATTESQIPVFETAAQQSIYALSVLLARLPADLLKQLSPMATCPECRRKCPPVCPRTCCAAGQTYAHPRLSCTPPPHKSVSLLPTSFRRFHLPVR